VSVATGPEFARHYPMEDWPFMIGREDRNEKAAGMTGG
jgi:hypothetical protein